MISFTNIHASSLEFIVIIFYGSNCSVFFNSTFFNDLKLARVVHPGSIIFCIEISFTAYGCV